MTVGKRSMAYGESESPNKGETVKRSMALILVAMIVFIAIGCGDSTTPTNSEQKAFEDKQTGVDRLMSNQPVTVPDFSMDRYLLDQRLVRFNDPSKMSYLYVFMIDGTKIQFTIVGKLTSTSKRLSAPEREYHVDHGEQHGTALGAAADEMGTYGASDPAHVGMSTVGSLIEIGGFMSYVYSETPIMFSGLDFSTATVSLTDFQKQQLLKDLDALKKQAGR